MKVSMWILFDWLSASMPEADIFDGDCVISSARIGSNLHGAGRPDPSCVYVWADTETAGGIVLQNGRDKLRIRSADMHSVFNDILHALDFFAFRLDGARFRILEGCRLQELIDIGTDIFDDPIFIQDSGFHIYGASTRFGADESLSIEKIMKMSGERIVSGKDAGAVIFESPLFPYPSITRNLFLHQKHIGWFVIILARHQASKGRLQLADLLGELIELWLRNNENSKGSEWYIVHSFTSLLNEEDAGAEQTVLRLKTVGWQEDDPKVVFNISSGSRGPEFLESLCNQLNSSFKGTYSVVYGNTAVMTANLRLAGGQSLHRKLSGWLRKAECHAGVSFQFTDIMKLKHYYWQAEIAAGLGVKADGVLNRCEDFAVDYCTSLIDRFAMADICHPALDKLSSYDQKNHTDLYQTLYVFLQCERNQLMTAEKLNLHRNSVAYRVSRIMELLDADLGNPQARIHLLLSYEIRKLQLLKNGNP